MLRGGVLRQLNACHLGARRMDNKSGPIGPAGWIAIVVLGAFLAVAIVYAVGAWNALDGTALSPAGWFFLILGVVLTVGVGGGLMWLVFYSDRHDYDR
jgi:hypothetical protein